MAGGRRMVGPMFKHMAGLCVEQRRVNRSLRSAPDRFAAAKCRLDRSRARGQGPRVAGVPPRRSESSHAPQARFRDAARTRWPRRADVHALYQAGGAVRGGGDRLRRRGVHPAQEAQGETPARGLLRTANAACEWVRRRRTNRAVAVDIDAGVLEWGRRHNVEPLGRVGVADRAGPRRRARRGPRRHGRGARDELQLLDPAHSCRAAQLLRQGARRACRDGVFFLDALRAGTTPSAR